LCGAAPGLPRSDRDLQPSLDGVEALDVRVLGGAVGVAAQLPEGIGTALLAAAREAFTQGMQLSVTLSAAVAVGIAVLATVLLRDVPATAQAEAGEPPTTTAEPVAVAQPEEPEPVQLIRSGSGCLACPGERRPSELPRLKLPKPLPDNPSSPTS